MNAFKDEQNQIWFVYCGVDEIYSLIDQLTIFTYLCNDENQAKNQLYIENTGDLEFEEEEEFIDYGI